MGGAGEVGERDAIVIGAGLAGIFATAALAASGWTVTLLERDRLPAGAEHRRGIPQDRQAHILLHRGLVAIEGLLPGFRAELLARDAVPFDTGRMPWLGEQGWLDTTVPGWEVVSATRPLMDAVARDLLRPMPAVTIRDAVRVIGIEPAPGGWRVACGVDDGTEDDFGGTRSGDFGAAVVVDASGRGSRLSRWLPGLGGVEPEVVDARVGYAGRLHAAREELPLHTGMMIFGSVPGGISGLALPVEKGRWMISESGMGSDRPPRDGPGFERFLARLRDPAIADLVAGLEPIGDVAIHRQTSNRRHHWGARPAWPTGLLALGDSLCSLNPIYGQGITVAALQAELLRHALLSSRPVDHRLQRELLALTEVPWSIATGNDLRFPSSGAAPSRSQRITAGYTGRLTQLAAAGNVRVTKAFSDVYHLMLPPTALFHPALLLAAARPLPRERLPRPAVLDELSLAARRFRPRQEQPPVGQPGA